jgi:polysaccharide export outer membrane protein
MTMAHRRIWLATILAVGLPWLSRPGAAQAPSAPAAVPAPAAATAPAAARAPVTAPNYRIGPEDVLSITLYDEASLGGKYAVELDGTFTFPFIGRVEAAGRTLRDVETALRTRLSDGYFKDPQVAVSVDTYRSRRVFVLGEVKTPGTLQITGELSLTEAIARAGSVTEHASDDVQIVRGGQGSGPATTHSEGVDPDGKQVHRLNLRTGKAAAAAAMLQDGDTVFVGKLEPVYVYGQVKNPGSYPIRANTTVLQALSLAGGGTPTGAVNRTRIIRTVSGEKKEYRAALTDIVQPGDTVMVPERFF